MLYKLHTNILIVGLLTIGFLTVLAAEKAFCVMTAGTVVAFIAQIGLVLFYSREKKVSYSGKELFWVVLGYSIWLGIIFMMISYYYAGDTFMLSKNDALLYYENSIRSHDIGFIANAKRLMTLYDPEDLGALIFDSALMAIIPSKIFLNAVYALTGALSAVMLFRMGKYFMPDAFSIIIARIW